MKYKTGDEEVLILQNRDKGKGKDELIKELKKTIYDLELQNKELDRKLNTKDWFIRFLNEKNESYLRIIENFSKK